MCDMSEVRNVRANLVTETRYNCEHFKADESHLQLITGNQSGEI